MVPRKRKIDCIDLTLDDEPQGEPQVKKTCIDSDEFDLDSIEFEFESDDESESDNESEFCICSDCNREEAIFKRELGGFTCGDEQDPHYFYFSPKNGSFTPEQLGTIEKHVACIYLKGEPCKTNDELCPCGIMEESGTIVFTMKVGPNTVEQECDAGLLNEEDEHQHHIGIPAPDQEDYKWHKENVKAAVDNVLGDYTFDGWETTYTPGECYLVVKDRYIERALAALKSVGLKAVYVEGSGNITDYTVKPIDENDERYTIQHRVYLDKVFCQETYVDINKVLSTLSLFEWTECDEGYYCTFGTKELRKNEKEFEQDCFYLNEWNDTVPEEERSSYHEYDFILQAPDDKRFAVLSRIYIDKDLFEYNDLNVEKVVQDIMEISSGWIKCDEGFYKESINEKFEGFHIKRWNNTVEEECPEHIYDFLLDPKDYIKYKNN